MPKIALEHDKYRWVIEKRLSHHKMTYNLFMYVDIEKHHRVRFQWGNIGECWYEATCQ